MYIFTYSRSVNHVDVSHVMCKHAQGCRRRPIYGEAATGKASYCFEHRTAVHVDVMNPRCRHPVRYACMHACVYACMYVCMHVCVSVCVYACMHVLIQAYVCMYVLIYKYI